MSNINQLLLRAAVAVGLLLVVSPPVRVRFQAFLRERGVFVLALAAAVWLSLGPSPQSLGRAIVPDLAPFLLFLAMGLVLTVRPQGLLGARA